MLKLQINQRCSSVLFARKQIQEHFCGVFTTSLLFFYVFHMDSRSQLVLEEKLEKNEKPELILLLIIH